MRLHEHPHGDCDHMRDALGRGRGREIEQHRLEGSGQARFEELPATLSHFTGHHVPQVSVSILSKIRVLYFRLVHGTRDIVKIIPTLIRKILSTIPLKFHSGLDGSLQVFVTSVRVSLLKTVKGWAVMSGFVPALDRPEFE